MTNSNKNNESTSSNTSSTTSSSYKANPSPMPGSQFGIYKPNNEPILLRENFNPVNNTVIYDNVDEK